MDSSSRKVKNLQGPEDMISNLPDEVLIYILSFMSTRDVVRTSILSSEWKDLWASVPNISFCPREWRPKRYTFEAFILEYTDFAERVLLRHNSSIHKFHIICSPEIDKTRFNDLISTVVNRDVRDITISIDGYHCPNLQLPKSLLTCRTLEILKLDKKVQFNVPSTIYIPRLKVLHVELTNPSKDLTEKLFCSSPVLEELIVEVKDDSGWSNYYISSPALNKLSIRIDAEGLDEDHRSVVTIDAPVLKVLEVSNYRFVRYTLKNTPSIVKASVVVSGRKPQRFRNLYKLLAQISDVRSLTLDYYTMTAFNGATGKKWPIFYNVTHLNLEVFDFRVIAESLSEWPSFPNLRHLQLYVGADFASRTLIIIRFQELFSTSQRLGEFDPSEQGMAKCLQSCVKEIEIRKLECWFHEMLFIEYLLKSAQVLEKLTIELCKLLKRLKSSEEAMQRKILAMPRFSKICQVIFV